MVLVQRSLLSELRALLAVARKEWIIFRRYPSWVVAFLIWPVLFPYAYVFVNIQIKQTQNLIALHYRVFHVNVGDATCIFFKF